MANNTVIKVEGLGKHYLLNKELVPKSDTLYGSFINNLKNIKNISQKKETIDFWALNDVSFDIQQGDRVGIIGRNGAGKSTLLKILSRITPPTKGRIEITGRVASLLEVGTGFHGDLSGRENIYLNGSILGMNKQEIDKKFDEIVAFSEIENFIDTPVKRYSSGMYVRLAFAVAAHLESEILIVDEVLAVGDAAFQKKCLGKMNDISKTSGRTILFVSHSMPSIIGLCNKGIFLEKGKMKDIGDISSIISLYNSDSEANYSGVFNRKNFDEKEHLISKVEIVDTQQAHRVNFKYNDDFFIKITTNKKINKQFGLTIKIKNQNLIPISFANSWISKSSKMYYDAGDEIIIKINGLQFVQGKFFIDIICNDWEKYHVDNFWDTVFFEIEYCKPNHSTIFLDQEKELGSLIMNNIEFL